MPGGGGGRLGPSSALAPSASPAPLPPSTVRLCRGLADRHVPGSEGSRILLARQGSDQGRRQQGLAPRKPSHGFLLGAGLAGDGQREGLGLGLPILLPVVLPQEGKCLLMAWAQAQGRGPHTVLELRPSPPPRPGVCRHSGHSLLRPAPAGRTGSQVRA